MNFFSVSLSRTGQFTNMTTSESLESNKEYVQNDGTKTLVYWQKEKMYIGPDNDFSLLLLLFSYPI